MSARDRKWKLAKAAFVIGAVISLSGLAGWGLGQEGAAGIIAQGLGTIAGVLTLYGAANVAQKGVVGAHYRSELDDRQKGAQ